MFEVKMNSLLELKIGRILPQYHLWAIVTRITLLMMEPVLVVPYMAIYSTTTTTFNIICNKNTCKNREIKPKYLHLSRISSLNIPSANIVLISICLLSFSIMLTTLDRKSSHDAQRLQVGIRQNSQISLQGWVKIGRFFFSWRAPKVWSSSGGGLLKFKLYFRHAEQFQAHLKDSFQFKQEDHDDPVLCWLESAFTILQHMHCSLYSYIHEQW